MEHTELDVVFKKYPNAKRDSLIPILQDVQELQGYLSRESVVEVGKYLGKRLEELKSDHICVGDVRYIGLFSVIEVVKDRIKKTPIASRNAKGAELEKMNEVGKFLRENGLFTFINANMIFIVPPLCITNTQIDEGLAIIDRALSIIDVVVEA